jgi:hypothetical protein
VLWRNTAYGHANTVENFFETPLTQPVNFTALRIHDYHTHARLQGWKYTLFEEQNQVIEAFFAKNFPKILLLDFFTSTVLRRDLHGDNLHYCLPGVLLHWVNNLFYNALQVIRKYQGKYQK